MKHYVAKNYYWKNCKALMFFANFIVNHNSSVNDNDTFGAVAELLTHDEWKSLIEGAYPAKTLARMTSIGYRRDRLDFDDETSEIIREVWSYSFARKRLRQILSEVIDRFLAEHPLAECADEPFAMRVAELQRTLSLSDFEMDILLVLAFVHCNLLCIADGHDRRSDENDKAIFIAKNLNCDVSEVMTALDERGKLRRYGCVDGDFDFNGALLSFLNGARKEPLSSSYFNRCLDEVLPW